MLGLAVVMCLLLCGCSKKAQQDIKKTGTGEGIVISTVVARTGDIQDKIRLIGTVFPWQQVNIYSKASGKLSKYLVEEGSEVKADGVIAYVDRDEPGFDFSPSPVKSSMAGIVVKRYLDAGAMVSPASQSVGMGTAIVAIGDIKQLKVTVNVVEQDIGRVKEGQPAEITVEAFPDEIFTGKVYNISPVADPASHACKVEIMVNNPAGRIKPGVTAGVNIIVGTHNNVVIIPRETLLRKMNDTLVYAIAGGQVARRVVKTGYDDGKNLEITDGLKSGEIIAASDFNVLQDGLKVQTGN